MKFTKEELDNKLATVDRTEEPERYDYLRCQRNLLDTNKLATIAVPISVPLKYAIDELDKDRALALAHSMLVEIGHGGSFPIQEFYRKLIAIERAMGIEHKG